MAPGRMPDVFTLPQLFDRVGETFETKEALEEAVIGVYHDTDFGATGNTKERVLDRGWGEGYMRKLPGGRYHACGSPHRQSRSPH